MAKENPARESASRPPDRYIRLLGVRPAFVAVESFVDLLNDRKYLVEIMSQQKARAPGRDRGDLFRLDLKSAVDIGFDLLRKLTDEWLDSGLTSRCAERPMQRNLRQCPRIREAAELRNSMVHMEWYAVSEKDIQIRYEMGDVGSLRGQLTEQASRIAVRLVVGMCNSDWKFKVAKCRKCGIYYRLSRNQQYYVRGTRHRKCFSNGSAEFVEDKRRKREHKRKLELAVRAFVRLGKKGKLPQRSNLAERLHAVLQMRPGASFLDIKKNWLTTNLDLIESYGDAALINPRGTDSLHLP